jgi:large subunit ribosomal protein L30
MAKAKTKTIKITQVRSGIGRTQDQRATLTALGLRRMHQTVERPDTPEVRGMVFKIKHLVEVDEG